MNQDRFASLLGLAALKIWPDLPRDVQERLFAAAVDDSVIASNLAEFLHDRHPRTAHPPKPTRLAWAARASKSERHPMLKNFEKQKTAPSDTRKDRGREMREKPRSRTPTRPRARTADLVHGGGGTLGLGDGEDLNKE